jgi:hypothetical protein
VRRQQLRRSSPSPATALNLDEDRRDSADASIGFALQVSVGK